MSGARHRTGSVWTADQPRTRFRALGVNLKQLYGQTESCALTAAQDDGAVKLHTVGKPMPGVQIRIADNGEIQIRSGSVIDGYFDDPEASAKAA